MVIKIYKETDVEDQYEEEFFFQFHVIDILRDSDLNFEAEAYEKLKLKHEYTADQKHLRMRKIDQISYTKHALLDNM